VIRIGMVPAVALALAAPALADMTVSPSVISPPVIVTNAVPRLLSDTDREGYRRVFAALKMRDYAAAGAALDALPNGMLTPVARAELLLADPTARDVESLSTVLASAPELPEATELAKFAPAQPMLPAQHALVRKGGPSKRATTRPTRDGAVLAAKAQPFLKAGDAAGAEAMVEAAADTVTPEALTEWRQKIAWAYFQIGDDASARRLASLAQVGAGDWSVDAAWVNGLANWRAGDFAAAAAAFDRVASNAADDETRAAGLFWAARSVRAAGDTGGAGTRLQTASRLTETFYGMLAGGALDLPPDPAGWADTTNMNALLAHPNLHAAAALMEIGEAALADQLIRHQAKIGAPIEHGQLIALAGRLGLATTQMWLAQNVPAGVRTGLAARFPMPAWAPTEGWRIDPALCYAHALQESELRPDAVSHSGARGLMQLLPTTAQLIARHKGDVVRPLDDPSVIFEYGQSYLEELASAGGTGGLLPKVIAAYNAGPNNVARWTSGLNDPLLFIESIPFVQTRAYVAIVLRNYWIYQRQAGTPTTSLTAMAQGRWPLFPTRHTVLTASAAGATYAPN